MEYRHDLVLYPFLKIYYVRGFGWPYVPNSGWFRHDWTQANTSRNFRPLKAGSGRCRGVVLASTCQDAPGRERLAAEFRWEECMRIQKASLCISESLRYRQRHLHVHCAYACS